MTNNSRVLAQYVFIEFARSGLGKMRRTLKRKSTVNLAGRRRLTCSWLPVIACVFYFAEASLILADEDIGSVQAVPAPDFSPLLTREIVVPTDSPIGIILTSQRHPLLRRADFKNEGEIVKSIYGKIEFQPIWFSKQASEKNLKDLLLLLSNAEADGLNPLNYDIDSVREWIENPPLDPNTTASYDVALTVSLTRFLHDLRQGRVDPRTMPMPAHIAPKPDMDLASLLHQHLAQQRLTDLVSEFEPKARQYRQLKHILGELRRQAAIAARGQLVFGKPLKPGDKHANVAELRSRLKGLGLLADPADPASERYDTDLVDAVKKLQRQAGLKADGVIGNATAALLTQSPAEKISRIELAMERARWIPDPTEGPMIVVNIPAFELWAFNSTDDQAPLNMKVIVGKAPENQTPVLWEEMKYLEFMPYWNIPSTIFKKEILPKTLSNKAYLASQEIELVRHYNSDDKGGGSYLRARQRPGKKNPLGRVKFVFPNAADVYLHDTPAQSAFNRPRRDLSHGCVRVSQPEQLAEFVLGGQKEWDKESIKQAMTGVKTRHVTLKRSVPVLFYYGTTYVDHKDQLHFYPDVYGQDEYLRKALEQLQNVQTPPPNSNESLRLSSSADLNVSP